MAQSKTQFKSLVSKTRFQKQKTTVDRSRPRLRFTDIRLDTLQEPASLDCSENTKANCQWLSAKALIAILMERV